MIARWLFIVLLLVPQVASAVCVPAMTVRASGVSFGTYDPGAASPTQSMGTVKVQCTVGLLPSFSVALSAGSSQNFAQRTMKNGSDALAYNLYVDPNGMSVWGDGTGATVTQSFDSLLSLGSTKFTVYGSAPSGQYPAAGNFSDTITVTVTY